MIKFSFDEIVAVYIDSDNHEPLDYAQQILQVSAYIGINGDSEDSPLRVYAYGDWKTPNLSKWPDKIDALEIQRIQVKSGKNATDNRILIDIGKTLGDSENRIDIYVIVSSDADFAALSEPILEAGKKFICIGTKGQTAQDLQNLTCYFLQDLDQHLSELKRHYVIPINILRRFWTILGITYVLEFGSNNEDWVSFSQLKEKFSKNPDFYQYDMLFGKYGLAQLISYCSDDYEIKQQSIRKIDHHPEYTRLFWLRNAFGKVFTSDVNWSKFPLDRPISIGKLGKTLREIDKNFENHFGSKKLSYWLRQYPEFEVDNNNVRRDPWKILE